MKTQACCLRIRLAVVAMLTLLVSVTAGAACPKTKVVPAGLNENDKYYLAFATEDQENAVSDSIADYNNFVQGQGQQCDKLKVNGKWITWKAVASTAKKSAKDNLGLNPDLPIYLVDGKTMVVAKAGDLFSGKALQNPISLNQSAEPFKPNELDTWTGTTATGDTSKFPLGNKAKEALTTKGLLTSKASPNWVDNGNAGKVSTFSFYAISEVLTAPKKKKQDLSDLKITVLSQFNNLVQVGQMASLVVSVQAQDEPVAGAVVEFADALGDLRFVDGESGFDDRQWSVATDASGEARAQFVVQQPGLSIIQAKAGNSKVQVSIASTNMPLK
jgi:hypothetical protein